jgi:hypothetical protein
VSDRLNDGDECESREVLPKFLFTTDEALQLNLDEWKTSGDMGRNVIEFR